MAETTAYLAGVTDPTTSSSYSPRAIKQKRYTADQVDFFVCCALDTLRFWILPFEAASVTTLKIYNGEDSKFHRYEDAWLLLEK